MQDSAPVKPSQPPKAVTVEDSFKSCTTPAAAAHVLKILAPDLLRRLQEEFEVVLKSTALVCSISRPKVVLHSQNLVHLKIHVGLALMILSRSIAMRRRRAGKQKPFC